MAAESVGISKPALLVTVFLFSGAVAGIAGGLFASLQSYITPDAFTFDLSVLFFIAILIGGRGSILGPLLGTIILTALPEFAAPLVAWSTFLYAVLLLVIVLVVPGGIADMLDYKNRRPLEQHREIRPRPELLAQVMGDNSPAGLLTLKGISLSFGGVQGDRRRGSRHPHRRGARPHRPQRQRQDHDAERDLRILCAAGGAGAAGQQAAAAARPAHARPAAHRPHLPDPTAGRRIFRPGKRDDRRHDAGRMAASSSRFWRSPAIAATRCICARRRLAALSVVGLEQLASVRSDRLQHSELRFVEIARALMLRPSFLLLDEPAAGLSVEEIKRLGALIVSISRRGTGVLLVEHHADLIFDICTRVTVLNLGKVLASGTPAEIRTHREVVNAYLGA